ncbi:hypothetical protein DENSPDRAFT_886320 [Dentipellis sp. KUC8613]|nr:hypothetical protein DENSPDRAFT_886320 [Dentipellis sp. KUC8613]
MGYYGLTSRDLRASMVAYKLATLPSRLSDAVFGSQWGARARTPRSDADADADAALASRVVLACSSSCLRAALAPPPPSSALRSPLPRPHVSVVPLRLAPAPPLCARASASASRLHRAPSLRAWLPPSRNRTADMPPSRLPFLPALTVLDLADLADLARPLPLPRIPTLHLLALTRACATPSSSLMAPSSHTARRLAH